MINFLATDKTTQKKYYNNYTVRETDRTLANRLKEKDELLENAMKTASLPKWLIIVSLVMLSVGSLCIAIGAELMEDIEDRNVIILLAGGAGATLLGFLLFGIQVIKMRQFKNSSAYADMTAELEKSRVRCIEDLRVPETAETLNLLVCEKSRKYPRFKICKMLVFAENDRLCLCDTITVAAVPLTTIAAIYRIGRNAFVEYTADSISELKMLGLKNTRNGYYSKGYYSLQFTQDGTEYEIDILPSEIEKITKFTKATII